MTRKAAAPIATAFAVVLPPEARPGIRAVGPYLPGREYTVGFAEATRLVQAKGFCFATDADAQRHRAATAALNAAAQPGTDSPANSDGQGGGTSTGTAQE